ncbi:hypothetical protein JW933_01025 [candidate division FCPU426 bacterium]|nr:hypothetical protein [candidate division FCPU426 bacterium]
MNTFREKMKTTRLRQIFRQAALFLALTAGDVVFFGPGLEAYFLDFASGVRPHGMGEAFVSVADDANAVGVNPAGLGRMESIFLSGMYSDLFTNLNASLFSETYDRLAFNSVLLAMPIVSLEGSIGLGWTQFNSTLYKENVVSMSYGKKIWDPHTLDLGIGCSLGATVKLLHWMVEESDMTANPGFYPYAERQKYGATLDAGCLLEMWDGISVGMSVDQLLPVNMGISTTEYVPRIHRAGVSYLKKFKGIILASLLAVTEVSERNNIYTPKLGIESQWWGNVFALRMGVNPENITGGFSFVFQELDENMGLQLDYAWSYPWQVLDTLGSHRVGVTLQWDITSPEIDAKYRKAVEVARAATSVTRNVAVAREAVKAAKKAAAEAGRAADSEDLEGVKAAVQDAEANAQTAALSAAAVREIAKEHSENLLLKAAEAEQAAQEAQQEAKQAQEVYSLLIKQQQDKQLQASGFPERAPYLPEKHPDKIVIGIERKIFADYGDLHEIMIRLDPLKKHLEAAVNMEVEWKWYSTSELELALQAGELDMVATYGADLRKYYRNGLIQPMATVLRDYKDTQQCLLITCADSPYTQAEETRNSRLGYPNDMLLQKMPGYFFANVPHFQAETFFASIENFTNAREALLALQVGTVDVLVDFEYVTHIHKLLRLPNDIKVLASSASVPNTPVFARLSRNKNKNAQMQVLGETLKNCHTQQKLKGILNYFGIDRFADFNEKKHKNCLLK